jgi:L-amino acid N-acyltransferase YncA
MNNFTIRDAKLEDASGIAKIHVETWQCAYKGQIPDSYLQSLSVEKRTERWKDILSNPKDNSHTLVAVEDGQVLGFCSVSHCRDEDMPSEVGELWAIYVDANKMGKGVGTALMGKGIEYLIEQGYKKATLWVLTSNEKTRKWYESKGWKVEGKTKTEKSRGFDIEETRYIIELENRF